MLIPVTGPASQLVQLSMHSFESTEHLKCVSYKNATLALKLSYLQSGFWVAITVVWDVCVNRKKSASLKN